MNTADGRWLNAARLAAFLLPILILAPFAGKPFQADDHVFIWVAEQIARAPLDFFGFEIDYGAASVPIYEVNHNPPAGAYWLALIGVLTNWNLVALHLATSLFAGLAALGTFELARDLGARPFAASAAATLTPAFLVSASTLMTDVPMLAFYVWAIVAWRRGCERLSWHWFLCATLCAAVASGIKFFGITLVPLLLLDGLIRRPRSRTWWVWLLIPLAAFGALQAYTYARYGTIPIFDAVGVAGAEHWRSEEQPATRPLLTLVFLGGAMLPLAFSAGPRLGVRWTVALAALVAAICAPIVGGYSLFQLAIGGAEPFSPSELLHFAVFLFGGVVVISGAVRSGSDIARREIVLLTSWVVGTIVFTAFVNHYINVRALLPMLPAIAVLSMVGHMSRWVPMATAAMGLLLSGWLLVADYDVAAHDAHAARIALDRATSEDTSLHYVAFWGFEYPLMNGGAKPLAFAEKQNFADPTVPLMEEGGLLVIDAYASEAWTPPPRGFTVVDTIDEPYRAFATTFDTHAQAGFYWHGIGILPYRFGEIAPENFLLLRWDGPADQSTGFQD